MLTRGGVKGSPVADIKHNNNKNNNGMLLDSQNTLISVENMCSSQTYTDIVERDRLRLLSVATLKRMKF